MQTTIFECPICYNTYGSQSKPLTLPCGHVFCQQCLAQIKRGSTIQCPSDKITHEVSIESLPCCFAIMANLPKDKLEFCCKRHPKKKIKFFCERHNEYLCTHCVIDHTGIGHKVNVCKIDVGSLLKKVEFMQNKMDDMLSKTAHIKSEMRMFEIKLQDAYNSQEEAIFNCYEAAISRVRDKKLFLIAKNIQMYDEQKQKVNEQAIRCKSLRENVQSINGASEKLISQNIKSYEEYVKIMENLSNSLSQCDCNIPNLSIMMPLFEGSQFIR
jgi:hypothetical protein